MESELTPYNLAAYDWLNSQNNKPGVPVHVFRWLCLSEECKSDAREGFLELLKSQGFVRKNSSIKNAEKTLSEMFEQNVVLSMKFRAWKSSELEAAAAREKDCA